MMIEDVLREATVQLRNSGLAEPRREANLLMAHVFEGDREVIFREPERNLSESELKQYLGFVARRSKREPASHILQKREFWSRDFFVNQHVLDPRPDSETLIAAVLEYAASLEVPLNILDLGTGSGCLLLTLLKELDGARGVGVDYSEAALRVAVHNARSLEIQTRADFLKSSWFDKVDGQFDIIISNPPYIERGAIELLQPEVRDFEPRQALDGGLDGLDCYRHIIEQAAQYLIKSGFIIFEVGAGQADDVAGLLRDEKFKNIQLYSDLAGIKRCVSGVL